MNLPSHDWPAIHNRFQRYSSAGQISILLSLVFSPFFFGGAALGVFFLLPEPAGLYAGLGLISFGIILTIGLIFLAKRKQNQNPLIVEGTLLKIINKKATKMGTLHYFDVSITDLRTLTPEGITGADNEKGKMCLLVPSEKIVEEVKVNQQIQVIMTPTKEVVGLIKADSIIE